MAKVIENHEYLDTSELMQELAVSRKTFYASVKSNLKDYHFDGKRKSWYRKSDVLALKSGKPVRKADIAIAGMYGSWTKFAQEEYGAETELRCVEITTLPSEAVKRFQFQADKQFVKRSQFTRVGSTVICVWDTYYPIELVSEILEPIKQDTAHVVSFIKETHGLTVGHNRDIYSSRMTTLEEQNLFRLSSDEPALILQRASYTSDRKTLVLYSDMTLLGSWFVHEHEYDVNLWSA